MCRRISGKGGEASAIFRLDTQYGGGKTHALIALAHVAADARTVLNIGEFVDPSLLPKGKVRVAAFDGENADPINGRDMGEGVRAFTPWGELAYALGKKAGYETLRKSDEQRVAPGAENVRALFNGEPAIILLDELSIYLRKVTENTVSGANWLVMAIGSDLEQWRSRAKSFETLWRASSCDGKREIAPQLLPAFGNHR